MGGVCGVDGGSEYWGTVVVVSVRYGLQGGSGIKQGTVSAKRGFIGGGGADGGADGALGGGVVTGDPLCLLGEPHSGGIPDKSTKAVCEMHIYERC